MNQACKNLGKAQKLCVLSKFFQQNYEEK